MKKIFFLLLFLTAYFQTVVAQAESDIVITEIMYNPPGNDTIEYIELYNKSANLVVMNGWSFTKGITHTFAGQFLTAGQYLILTNDKEIFEDLFGTGINTIEWQEGGLDNSGESIVLKDFQGMIQDSVFYRDSAPWPTGPIDPDGDGTSIALCDPEADNSDPLNWTVGDVPTGIYLNNEQFYIHPGTTCSGIDFFPPVPENAYAVSSTQIIVEYNEPVNQTAELAINYTGLGNLTADLDATFQTVTIDLETPLQDGVLETLTITDIQDFPGNQMERIEDFNLIWHSTGEVRDIIITEIMYNAPGNDSLDFIELYNNSGIDQNLWGCYFDKGFDFTFPDYTLPSGGYVILAEDSIDFELTYGITPFKWSGSLDNNTEALSFKYVDGDSIDYVKYNDNMGWDTLADGYGHSLVLCDFSLDNADSLSWQIATTFTGITIGDTLAMYANPAAYDTGCPVDITTPNSLEGVRVFPNPNTGIFTLQNQQNTPLTCTIYDLYGRQIRQQKITMPSQQIDLHDVPNGVYLIHLLDENTNQSTTRKIIKSSL